MRAFLTVSVLLGLVLVATVVSADEVIFVNGDRLTGKILSAAGVAEGDATSSITRRNAGNAIRGSRQARCPTQAMAAGIDAASMARRCQAPSKEPQSHTSECCLQASHARHGESGESFL